MTSNELASALARLDGAVERLETAADSGTSQLARLRTDNAALRDTTQTVSKRLDAVTSRLKLFAGE